MSVDKIICVGKNYAEHILEMGDPKPEYPVIFLKPQSSLKQINRWDTDLLAIYPAGSGEVYPECEIVVRVNKGGYRMDANTASSAIDAVTLGLDMTLRTLQAQLKKNGHPWTTAKVFRDSAIIGPWIPLKEFKQFMSTDFTFSIDGNLRQRGRGDMMLMKPSELLVYISQFFAICDGDIIFTGTPGGVGAISKHAKAEVIWDKYHYTVLWNGD